MREQYLTIENMVKQLGITPRTLHYYEEIGLIQPVCRTEGRHRLYDEKVMAKIKRILWLKEHLGLSLQEIRLILEAEESLEQLRESYRRETSDEEKTKIVRESIEILEKQVKRIDEKMDQLGKMREGFVEGLTRCKRLVDPDE